jgi:XTP/dITP diphosphohydrolase
MGKLKYSQLTFVSGNLFKYQEYCRLLGIQDLRLAQVSVAEIQSLNLYLLVEKKIESIKVQLPDAPFFVEHTGLVVDAWRGLPGGLTSVFMDTVGNGGICKMMRAYKGNARSARAQVVIGYYHRDSGVKWFDGEVVGSIAEDPRGSLNFGWDPIFIPDGETRTYAEMSPDDKNKTSMRWEAAANFAKYLDKNFEL